MLLMENDWRPEIERRLLLPQFRDRLARVRFEQEDSRLRFTISDEGNGFEWQRYLDFDPSRVFDPNGRGIAMAHRTSFSSLEYLGSGSTVVATVNRTPVSQAAGGRATGGLQVFADAPGQFRDRHRIGELAQETAVRPEQVHAGRMVNDIVFRCSTGVAHLLVAHLVIVGHLADQRRRAGQGDDARVEVVL